MNIQEKEVLIAEIERFKEEAMKSYVVSCWAESYTNTDPFGYVVLENENNKVWWLKTQAYQLWEMWQAAKAQAVQEIDELKAQLSTEKSLRSMCEHLINTKQDEIIELKAKAQAVPEWISVKDRLPKNNILVLAMSQTVSNIFNVYDVMALDEFEEADVTHWMPLPDAPQEPIND